MNKETPRFARITRMSERLADLCRRLWKDNDPAAVSLQSILEEYREDTINVARIIPEYEKAVKDKAEAIKHEFEISYGGKMEVLEAQLRELKAKSAEAEEKCVLKDSKILELSGIIEKREKELEELNAKVFGAESDYNARFNSKVQQLYEETGKKEAERAHFWENRHKMIEEKSGDLEKKYLRTIGQPFIRFKQDPVRMIRLLKFRARFEFEIDHDTRLALIESKQEILKSSSARILEELLRMLESGSGEEFLTLMIEYGLLQLLLPALASFMETEEGEIVYLFLEAIDDWHLKDSKNTLDRSILLASLVFPLFQKRIQILHTGKEKPPHLGEIQNEAFQIFQEAFGSFFLIPKIAP